MSWLSVFCGVFRAWYHTQREFCLGFCNVVSAHTRDKPSGGGGKARSLRANEGGRLLLPNLQTQTELKYAVLFVFKLKQTFLNAHVSAVLGRLAFRLLLTFRLLVRLFALGGNKGEDQCLDETG